MNLFTIAALNTKHQVEVQEMWLTSIDFQMMNKIIKHSWWESFNILNYQKNWSLLGIHVNQ